MTKFSIITPSFNQAKYLEKTILSVINQKDVNLEYIIIDGGSTDGSVDIIKKYEAYLTYWISEVDNGQADAINKGLKKATGSIIAWLNSDDYYEPGALKKVLDIFSLNPTVGLVYGGCNIYKVDKIGNIKKDQVIIPENMDEDSLLEYWKGGFLPPQPSIFWSKNIQDKTNLLNKNLNYAMDLDFWLQMTKLTRFVKSDAILSNYLIHPESKSGSAYSFEKFTPEWRLVTGNYLSEKSLMYKIRYHLNYFFFRFNVFVKSGYKKLPIKILSFILEKLKKIFGIKSFGILSANE
ncbi:MAG: glycosyltransferase family 2 protein [Bacteroidota bacterium]|jgi:glycosyltransferase involved in cell wall biosynthesis